MTYTGKITKIRTQEHADPEEYAKCIPPLTAAEIVPHDKTRCDLAMPACSTAGRFIAAWWTCRWVRGWGERRND
jgi:hypothetical protein